MYRPEWVQTFKEKGTEIKKIRNEWHRSEITQKTQRLFAKIQIDYLK